MHRILCVDDERSVLQALRRLFMDEADYDVRLAGSGDEALALMEAWVPDLIVSDYRMPGLDGVEFLKRARARHPDALRLILSGYADAAVIVKLINEGEIYKFIPKPWDDAEMLVTIRRALEQHELILENRRLTQMVMERNEELRRINEELERRVEQRTGELLFKNRAYRVAMTMLDQLAVGIVGICDDGTIVQANRLACRLLSPHGGALVGAPVNEALPSELAAIVLNRGGGTWHGYDVVCAPLEDDGVPCGTVVQLLPLPRPSPAEA